MDERLVMVYEKWRHLDALLSSNVELIAANDWWHGPILPRYVAHDLWVAIKAAMEEDLR